MAAEVTVRELHRRLSTVSVHCTGSGATPAVTLEAVNRWVNTLGRTDAALDGHGLHVHGARAARPAGACRACRRHAPLPLPRGRAGSTDHRPHARPARHLQHADARDRDRRQRADRLLGRAGAGARPLSAVQRRRAWQLVRRTHPATSSAGAAASEETARLLVEAALDVRVGDNATALVVDVLDLPPANQTDLEAAIAQQRMIAPPRAGAVVDGFALEAMLSDGQYSRVFRATDTVGQRRVVVKFPKPVTGADALLRQAFLREAWIAARVKQPLCRGGHRRRARPADLPLHGHALLRGRDPGGAPPPQARACRSPRGLRSR